MRSAGGQNIEPLQGFKGFLYFFNITSPPKNIRIKQMPIHKIKTTVIIISMLISSFLLHCSGTESYPPSVNGSISIPDDLMDDVNGTEMLRVRASLNINPDDEYVVEASNTWAPGSTGKMYYILHPPAGEYYVYTWLDTNSDGVFNIGDHLGYFRDSETDYIVHVIVHEEADVFGINIVMDIVDQTLYDTVTQVQ